MEIGQLTEAFSEFQDRQISLLYFEETAAKFHLSSQIVNVRLNIHRENSDILAYFPTIQLSEII